MHAHACDGRSLFPLPEPIRRVLPSCECTYTYKLVVADTQLALPTPPPGLGHLPFTEKTVITPTGESGVTMCVLYKWACV